MPSPGGGSSRAAGSARLPGPVLGISTPLSLLGALPRGEGLLLQEDWAWAGLTQLQGAADKKAQTQRVREAMGPATQHSTLHLRRWGRGAQKEAAAWRS